MERDEAESRNSQCSDVEWKIQGSSGSTKKKQSEYSMY